MSRQRMPIVEALKSGEVVTRGDKFMFHDDPTKSLSDFINNPHVIRVNCQASHDIFWSGDKDDYTIDDLGPAIPPYPFMWLEWEHSGMVRKSGKWVDVPHGGVYEGKIIQEMDMDDVREFYSNSRNSGRFSTHVDKQVQRDTSISGIHKSFVVSSYQKFKTRDVDIVEHIPFLLNLDSEGRYMTYTAMMSDEVHDGLGVDTITEVVGLHALETVLALNLMNCRNVTMENSGPIKYRQTTKEKRARAPRLEYKTITLPGGAYVSQPGKGEPGAAPLHRVRGHFKTYTAEAPLMGKHVGTYWWGWQVRGKSENGVRVSDYKLGVPS